MKEQKEELEEKEEEAEIFILRKDHKRQVMLRPRPLSTD